MGEVITKLRIDTDEYQNRVRRASTSLNDMAHQAEVAGNKVAVFSTKNVQLARSLGSMQTASTTLRGKVSELSEAFVAAGHNYNTLTHAERQSPYGRALAQSMEQLKARIRETKSELAGLEGQLSGGKRGFGAQFMQGLIPGFGMGTGIMGAMAAVKGVQMLKDATVAVVNTNMDFEQSNANLAAILGKTADGISRLTENAKQLGGSTKFTASEITQLQTVLARRGLGEDQILNMTHGITNLAIATGTDLAQSAELAASTMQAFGMKATDMERIVSVLGVSTTKSALTTEALATSLQYVAPASRAAGFSLEDTVSILGTLVDNGINASTAGTSLRQILLSMTTSSGKLAKALGGPVKSFDDLVVALNRLKNEGGNSLEAVSKAVRVTALPAFLALVNNADRLNELRDSITGVDGDLQKMADTQMDTAKGAQIVFKSALEGLKLTFEESNGVMKDYYQTLTDIVNKWKEVRALKNGGQSAVNVLIGDPKDFKKKTEEAAKNFIQDFNNGAMASAMRGGGAAGMVPGTNWGEASLGVTWTSNGSEYANAYDKARAALKEDKALYEKLIPLSREYARHKVGIISAGTSSSGAAMTYVDTIHEEIKGKVKNLTGRDLSFDQLTSYMADMYKNISMYEEVLRMESAAGSSASGVAGVDEETEGDKIANELKKLAKAKTPAERAADVVSNATVRYNEALSKAAIEKDAGLLDEEKYSKRLLSAEENLMDAYATAASIYDDPQYKDALKTEVEKVKELASATASLVKAREDATEAEKLSKEANRELITADRMVLNGIGSSVGKTAWQRINESDGGALYGRLGAMKLQLANGVEIPDETIIEFVNELNQKLEKIGAPKIKVDLETSTVTKLTDEVKNMSSAWQYAGQIIGSVSNALSALENPAAKVAGIIAGALAEMAAGLGAAIAQKGKEMEPWSWIAFTAASTATLVSSAAAVKKAVEYHANGGIVGMNGLRRGTDVVPAMLTPGEEVLPASSPRHINNIGMLGGNLYLEKVIGAEDIRIILTNNNRRRGRQPIGI